MNPEVSVIIPTSEQTYLERCLKALESQDIPKEQFEVIVVENGRHFDETQQVVSQAKLNAHYEYVEDAGANHARNHGIKVSSGAIIALTDDDCMPHSNWLASILQRRSWYDDICVLGGRVNLKFETAPPEWLIGVFRATLAELRWEELIFEGTADCYPILERKFYLVTANLICSRHVFEEVGMFDEQSGYCPRDEFRHSDELVFLQAVRDRNPTGVQYCPSLIVDHIIPEWRMTLAYQQKRFYGQGRADIATERYMLPERSLIGLCTEHVVPRMLWVLNNYTSPPGFSDLSEDGKQEYMRNITICLSEHFRGMCDYL